MNKFLIFILISILPSFLFAIKSVEAYGVGSEKNIAKELLFEDALKQVIKANNIDLEKNKAIIEDNILIDARRFIEKIKIIKFDKLSGFYSIKATVNVRDEFLMQLLNQLISNKEHTKENEIKKDTKQEEDKEELTQIIQVVASNLDDAKNLAKSIAFKAFANKYDTRYSNLDTKIFPEQQTSKIEISNFEVLSQKEIRKGLLKLDAKVVVLKNKLVKNNNELSEESKDIVKEIRDNKEVIEQLDHNHSTQTDNQEVKK